MINETGTFRKGFNQAENAVSGSYDSLHAENSSKKSVDDLERLLKKEIELQLAFLSVSELKTKALVKLEFDNVERLTGEEQQVLSALAMIINSRVNILSRIAKERKVDNLSVSAFAQDLSEPDRSTMLDLSSKLRSVMILVNKVVKRNKALTEAFMSTTNDFFKTICSAVTEEIAYSRVGDNLKESAPRFLIDHVV